MNSNNNNNNNRAYERAHETEICHDGRLGCWVEGRGAAAARRALLIVEGLAFAVLAVGLVFLCAVA